VGVRFLYLVFQNTMNSFIILVCLCVSSVSYSSASGAVGMYVSMLIVHWQ
jgi:hypothetical protein